MARGLELSGKRRWEAGRGCGDVLVERARNGQHEEREWTYVRKDGGHLTVNLVVTASRDASGEIAGSHGFTMAV